MFRDLFKQMGTIRTLIILPCRCEGRCVNANCTRIRFGVMNIFVNENYTRANVREDSNPEIVIALLADRI